MTHFAEIVRKGRGWLTLMAICSLASAGVTLALPAVLGSAIDAIVSGGEVERALIIATALIALAVATDLAEAAAGVACVAGTTAWLRLRTVRHLLSLSAPTVARFETGDLVSRVSGNAVDAAQAGTSLAVTAVGVLAPLGSLILLALIDVWIALAFLAGVWLVAMVLRAFTRRTTAVALGYQKAQGAIATGLTEALAGIRTIAAAATAEQEERRILRSVPELSAHGRRLWTVLARTSAQATVVGPVVLVAVLAVGGFALTQGRITPGELFAASRYAVLGAGLGGLTGVLGALARARAGTNRLAEVFTRPSTAYGAATLPTSASGTLRFRQVSVKSLLHNVDLTLPGGASVAVVGRSGSGKSVLAELAARLRDPDSGAVLLDGIPLPELTHHELRRAIGCAFERPHLIGGTVGEAIALGRDPASAIQAARSVQAHSFVIRLPSGYQTPLAQTPMSGGERQRLGLARAWHAERLLVLDDATSSLDMVTEMKIAQALLEDDGRTRLIVTHRVPTAARADLVVWLEEGRVQAIAPHHLLWPDPRYRAVLQPETP
ncbi:ABC transporter ATP-binding protein [Rhizocola hellebori]|uniref:ABC transporter ATP-binding protein n=1 Tax=Rhizocola hellebori TaxID=1392758 RepID=A0A8J3QEJ1_9ACTN|nr:ABC transporter ATP-binding protein [Rhizocola hellebori]GIH08183.1 ABC transporter ATP-binding protein [Rhizocola hellebori]